jgi:O-antigen/teichoic acid export membrane protein
LRGRYDLRSLFLAWAMLLRLAGIAVGAHFGVAQAVAGVLAAQIVSTLSVGVVGWLAYRRFPSASPRPLAEDRREIVSFVLQSSTATGILSLRGGLAPLLLGAVTNTRQVGLFRVAQAPQSGFQALSAPARMVLLTEQTRAWEKGHQSVVLRGVRRYSLVAGAVALIAVPPLLIWIPDLIRVINGPSYVGASSAARILVIAAAVQLVVGWTKSFPVTIGRPGLRILTHGVETAVVLPLTLVFGYLWGAAGAAAAVLAGMCAFAAIWAVVFARINPDDVGPPSPVIDLGPALP